ncbi:retrovirus-related Pol polyprotein from transposon 297 [Nephila pilipes]|uniref:Retrovirus-related Pol polyprotein from transposon 297 n=1 Tax=Nephila pilipes TaxID=299642 RepID=A0A8X6UI89_NEPPI|nr:retrovirus-related Pol polyprotein from transposon 297 [Nephila pilipes]
MVFALMLENVPSEKSSLNFLGFELTENGIEPLPVRVQCIPDFFFSPQRCQLRRFLGMFNLYHKFIAKATDVIHPLEKVLEGYKNNKKSWCDVKKSEWRKLLLSSKASNRALL